MIIHLELNRKTKLIVISHIKKERQYFRRGEKWKAGHFKETSIRGKSLLEVKVEGPVSREKLIDALRKVS